MITFPQADKFSLRTATFPVILAVSLFSFLNSILYSDRVCSYNPGLLNPQSHFTVENHCDKSYLEIKLDRSIKYLLYQRETLQSITQESILKNR